jgi:polar amino acid transport system substrate-binding protein
MTSSRWGRRALLAAIGFCSVGSISFLAHAESKLAQIKKQGYIRLATANEIPYGYMDPNGGAAGIGPDSAKAVLKSMGITDIQWVVTPFGSLIPGLKANRFDMVAAEQNILPDRCKQVLFTQPNSSYGEGLLVKAGNPKDLHSYEDIKKNPAIKVAVVSGADQLDFLHGVGVSDSQIVMIPTNADALSTVETGRADAYAATELTVARLAQHSRAVASAQPFKDPVVNGNVIRSYGGFSFRMQDKDLYNAFNTALVAFKKTPEWQRILSSYGLGETSIKAAEDTTMQQLCAGK